MAKISPVSLKYIIHAEFEASGAIEKPDIIGAIFGQTEGLLGDDLEMRELQKSGKIGRIEANIKYDEGKTTGEIEVPSAMDKTETTIIGAALETIERVGPTDTKITITEIEDVRGSKRDYILERAKKLMEKLGDTGGDIDEMTDELNTHRKASKIQSYGTENIACGNVSGPELIIVEGRADVVNMLKKGVDNVIAMNGTKLPETVVELSKEKDDVTLFVDGDRGGNLIIKNVTENAKIDHIAMAPEGKEVEELTSKEILQALRKKVPAKGYKIDQRSRGVNRYDRDDRDDRDRRYNRDREDRYDKRDRDYKSERSNKYDRDQDSRESQVSKKKDKKDINKMTSKEKDSIKDKLNEIKDTKNAILFNKDLESIKTTSAGRLGSLRLDETPYIIAIDDIATPKIIENAEKLGCDNLIASNFTSSDTDINLVSL
jgi:DNA primase